MLKSYVGKKISLIMEKTTVDFVSADSSIFYCFFFLDPPLVMSACYKTARYLPPAAVSFS